MLPLAILGCTAFALILAALAFIARRHPPSPDQSLDDLAHAWGDDVVAFHATQIDTGAKRNHG